MSTAEIAKDLVQLCRQGKFDEAMQTHYADNIVSIEPMEGPMAELHGLQAVKEKGEWWAANYEIHEVTVGDPFVSGDEFVVPFTMDLTQNSSGQRMKGAEVGVYKVSDGKIVHERFFNGV